MDHNAADTARWSDAPKPSPEASPADRAPGANALRPILRGLLTIGLIALIFSIARAGLHRAFIPHWWTKW